MANKSTPARWIPKGSAKVALKNGAAVAYLSGGGAARPFAVAYIGNSGKPAWSYSFKDEARRAAYVSSWLASMEASKKARDARVAERKAKLAKPHGLKVGDVLSGSWGYGPGAMSSSPASWTRRRAEAFRRTAPCTARATVLSFARPALSADNRPATASGFTGTTKNRRAA